MKIGLLTYHHVVNPGSVLQTYCGYKLLQSLYPKALIEIIDYYPEVSQAYNRNRAKQVKNYNRRRVKNDYRFFLKKHCTFSSNKILIDDFEIGIQKIIEQNYEKVFVGSDTVFQLDGYLGIPIAGPKAPNLYYLPGKTPFEKYGLAASFDPPQEIEPEFEEIIIKHLSDFKVIFYRDEHAKNLLNSLNIDLSKMYYCPDPSLLIDFHSLINSNNLLSQSTKSTIGVSITSAKIRKTAFEYLERKGKNAIDMLNLFHKGKGLKCLNHDSFENKLNAYRNIDGLITDRFHGSILGFLLGNYPVVGVENDLNYKDNHGKLWDLFARLNNQDSLIRSENGTIKIQDLEKAWDASFANKSKVKVNIAELRLLGIKNLTIGLNL